MNINSSWRGLLRRLIDKGNDCKPRGMLTKEILGYRSCIDMCCPILTTSGRGLNHKFLCGEAHWILSGSNRVKDISKYMKNIANYSDNGITFRGAYGPQILEQLDYVVEALVNDTDCRQAVLTIWRQNPRPSKDIPCTVAMQWFIRDNKLHCVTTMRSSDAWLGWVYDAFNFSMISAWVAIALRTAEGGYPGLELGNLTLNAGSQHLYERDFAKAQSIVDNFDNGDKHCEPIDLSLYSEPDGLLLDLKDGADQNFEHCTPFIKQLKK